MLIAMHGVRTPQMQKISTKAVLVRLKVHERSFWSKCMSEKPLKVHKLEELFYSCFDSGFNDSNLPGIKLAMLIMMPLHQVKMQKPIVFLKVNAFL